MDKQLRAYSSESDRHSPIPSDASSSKGSTTFSSSQFAALHNNYSGRLPNPPTMIDWNGMRFLIMDAPSEGNIDLYLREMQRQGVTDLVRVCDPTYSRETVEGQGISMHEMTFPDGEGPPESIINAWLDLVDSRLAKKETSDGSGAIAVHCVAGLGRAPVLVAIALIEAGMSPLDAVSFLRDRRRGTINNKQLRFLESYKRRSRLSQKCTIM